MSPPVPLWRQLQAAASVLAAVRRGESATPALARVAAELRPGAQALVFHVLRNLGRAEALRKQLAKRAPPPAADALLCTALALAWREEGAPYAPFTLVDQAVEAAKRSPETRAQQAFINACLRRFLRERDALVQATDADPVARWNHPRWWIQKLRHDWPQDWERILEANNAAAPMTLRVNASRATVAAMQERFAAAGIAATRNGEYGLTLERPMPVQEIPGFGEGAVSVQDAAAQLAAPLVMASAGAVPKRILDACAAPGGKTAHIAELAPGAELLALDVDPARCERIHENLQRLGLQAEVLAADAGETAQWWDGRPFDAILLDAPCTASGIVRRHPDVRWLRREGDVAQLARQQERLLTALWPLLAPGGRLVYCTCSVFKAEGEAQVEAFVAHNSGARLRPATGHLRPSGGALGQGVPDNEPGDHDGFFYAVLEKSARNAPAHPAVA
ncbi:16S rRNA (cytosine(967)-C(5))-methyltransferase RsmB [Ramlibacter sp. G-1-2-2]|uniref:16S rRNA (cytosine(967)-C(5))-methyltransferase n=1 Tax=Ramlibacter agri TaxID=2728837 RepID=A0A848HKW0_9BURK|nr:16S rRNA (cytosine(967)-C(5))-methyltransferase RsmB [Ramlibacter agri]NML48358.1 16S rRNA (cytosine(967)-C(5))-methyltransferase RsmB [Ramlibacter agri]